MYTYGICVCVYEGIGTYCVVVPKNVFVVLSFIYIYIVYIYNVQKPISGFTEPTRRAARAVNFRRKDHVRRRARVFVPARRKFGPRCDGVRITLCIIITEARWHGGNGLISASYYTKTRYVYIIIIITVCVCVCVALKPADRRTGPRGYEKQTARLFARWRRGRGQGRFKGSRLDPVVISTWPEDGERVLLYPEACRGTVEMIQTNSHVLPNPAILVLRHGTI